MGVKDAHFDADLETTVEKVVKKSIRDNFEAINF
jgi:hypothetical protein